MASDPVRLAVVVVAILPWRLPLFMPMIILSHVNDAGFWLVKEYFQLNLPDTFKSWTLMETLLSVLGLIFVLLLSLVV
jgi:H+/gluconate symporter-like permease